MGIIIAIIIAIVLFYLIKVAIKANKSNVMVDPVSPHQKEIKENEVPIYKKYHRRRCNPHEKGEYKINL